MIAIIYAGSVVHTARVYPCLHGMDEVPVHCGLPPALKFSITQQQQLYFAP